MRGKKHLLYVMLTMMCVLSAGCGSREREASALSGQKADEGQLTKGQWIELLGDKFGYDTFESGEGYFSDVGPEDAWYSAVCSCKQWEILTEEDKFFPEEKVSWEYAIETSVRAIGVEKLNQSEIGMKVTEENLLDFFSSQIASVEEEALESGVSQTDAELILRYAYDFGTNLVLPKRCDVVYMEGVKEAKNGTIIPDEDGYHAFVTDGSSYEEGDIIYMAPTVDASATALKVSSVEGSTITYEQAVMEEVIEDLVVTGTFEAETIIVEAEEGVRVSLEDGSRGKMVYASYAGDPEGEKAGGVTPVGFKVSGNTVSFDKTFDNGASLNIEISGIKVTTDIDYGVFRGLKKADATLSFDDSITASYKQEKYGAGQYNLGKIKMPLGGTPVTAEFSLIVNLGFNGEVTLTYTSNIVAKTNYQQGKGFAGSVENQNTNCDFHADATLTVEPVVKAELCCFSRGIVNAKVTSGVVAVGTADVDLLGDQPACLDLQMWVPLRWALNEDGCILSDLIKEAKISKVVWDSENSRIKKHLHFEDLILVEVCTRGEEKKVETKIVEEKDEPFEYKVFEFKELVFGFIQVSTQAVHLASGESKDIRIISLPGGYSASDLKYTVENSSICSVNGGTVRAGGTGSTRVIISTGDGKFNTYISVFVEQEYHDTSGFEPL